MGFKAVRDEYGDLVREPVPQSEVHSYAQGSFGEVSPLRGEPGAYRQGIPMAPPGFLLALFADYGSQDSHRKAKLPVSSRFPATRILSDGPRPCV